MALQLVSVSKRFGRHVGLADVSLHVRKGDCYGFIGHNGAGKTTAMRIALGLSPADSGQVLVEGFDARRYPREARARMGALIEAPGFHARWSGTQNLARLARLAGLSRRDAWREAQQLCERVGLAHAAERQVGGYSQGMRQRLGIAQAMIGDPPILVLDEPTNGLDPEGIADVRSLLRRLVRDEGRTVLVSSHQLTELADICNRIGVLRHGRLVVEEETEHLLAKGRRRYRIEVADGERARSVLAGLGLEAPPEIEGGDGRIELGPRAPEDVVRALVEDGAGLRAFAPEPESLEEIYLRATRGASEGDAPSTAEPVTAGAPGGRRAPAWPVLRVVHYELVRWGTGRAVPLLLAAPAVLAALAVWRRHTAAVEHAREIAGGTLYSATGVTAFEAVGVGLQAGLPLAALVVLGIASQSLAGELARGTLRNVLVRPVTRLQVVAGKGLAALLAALGGYAMLLVGAFGAAAVLFDFGDVVEVLPNGATFPLVAAEELRPELQRAVLSPILPLCAFATLGLGASALPRTGASALALGLAAAVALDLGRGVLRGFDLEWLVPSTYLPSPLGDRSFMQYYVDVAQGVSNALFELADTSVLVPAVWIAFGLVLATVVLRKRFVP